MGRSWERKTEMLLLAAATVSLNEAGWCGEGETTSDQVEAAKENVALTLEASAVKQRLHTLVTSNPEPPSQQRGAPPSRRLRAHLAVDREHCHPAARERHRQLCAAQLAARERHLRLLPRSVTLAGVAGAARPPPLRARRHARGHSSPHPDLFEWGGRGRRGPRYTLRHALLAPQTCTAGVAPSGLSSSRATRAGHELLPRPIAPLGRQLRGSAACARRRGAARVAHCALRAAEGTVLTALQA